MKLLLLAFLLCSVTIAQAQKPRTVVNKIADEIKTAGPDWMCATDKLPEGTPGPQSPVGTKFQFSCTKAELFATVYVFVGFSDKDAENALGISQRLQINLSKPTRAFGTEAYELKDQRLSWIAFRRENIFGQIKVQISDRMAKHPPDAERLIEETRFLAQIVDRAISR